MVLLTLRRLIWTKELEKSKHPNKNFVSIDLFNGFGLNFSPGDILLYCSVSYNKFYSQRANFNLNKTSLFRFIIE